MASDLISRLESATEGSWELDIDFLALFGWECPRIGLQFDGSQWRNAPEEYVLPTQNLHEALGFAKPPGFPLWTYTIAGWSDSSPAHDLHKAEITVPSSEFIGHGRTAPLALCAAIVRMITHPRVAPFVRPVL